MSKKYLYGASVQGIQGFIFQTQALREIAGGSELVEQICTTTFAEAIGINPDKLNEDQNAIVTAAGNIKYIFNDKDKCASVVRSFPKTIMEMAPGITISQAVVEIEDFVEQKHVDLLEEKLRTQRNLPFMPIFPGTMGVLKSRRTGLPVVGKIGEEYIDESQFKKRRSAENERIGSLFFGKTYDLKKMPFDLKDITRSKGQSYSWLAIVHADGNNMGQIIQKMASELSVSGKKEEYAKTLRQFSLLIDKATKEAASEACMEAIKDEEPTENFKFPFRPVIIGGDDITVICRADLAIPFTQFFLEKFAKKSKLLLADLKLKALENGLTACAGIAFIKESYPFHYGYSLAETLCSYAKKEAKSQIKDEVLTPSCLMFHKVLDSYVESFSDIIKRELTIGLSPKRVSNTEDIIDEKDKENKEIRLDFGPYYLAKEPKLETLMDTVRKLVTEDGKPIKSSFRQWLTLLYSNPEMAHQKLNRMISVGNKNVFKDIGIDEADTAISSNSKTPVYDWLTIISINEGGN